LHAVDVRILIPLKRLAEAKQRLAPAMDGDERERLMLSMVTHVAREALASGAAPVALASCEPRAVMLASSLGIELVTDGGLPWNEGLVHARGLLEPGAEAVLYLAGDLPLLRAAEVTELVRGAPERGVVVGRAHDGGTNALLVRPIDAITPSFGSPRSAAVHVALAESAGLEAVVLDRPGLALDVDTPDDVLRAGLRLPA
jgi:2-phospho-L-lactate/phosphoenolpyruvate guanylyltransferase